MAKEREFEFTEADFKHIKEMVVRRTGICLSDAKKDMVYSRLARRLRSLRLNSFSEYRMLLETEPEQELVQFTNAITTNLTSFFREGHHFDHLSTIAIPEILSRNRSSKKIRIWSAGCSTGEEPYSIAITLLESALDIRHWDVKILATDLDSNVLDIARQGIYAVDKANEIPKDILKRWFKKGSGDSEGKVIASEDLKRLITFKELNLMESWPMRGPFDVIFCRNVVIYFDKQTQKILFNRYADLVHDDAYLYVGHSESLYRVSDRFKLLGNTIYKRI